MDLRDKFGHHLEIGDCVVSVDRDNNLFIGRIEKVWKVGSLKITRITRNQWDGRIYTVEPNHVIKFKSTPEFVASLLRQ